MPKPAPFILLATFLTHDNNFHLYLSRECEKRALHHRARVPRGCRISRPAGLGPHLRGRGAEQGGHGLSGRQIPVARAVLRDPRAKGRRKRGCSTGRCRRLGGRVGEGGERWRLSWLEYNPDFRVQGQKALRGFWWDPLLPLLSCRLSGLWREFQR